MVADLILLALVMDHTMQLVNLAMSRKEHRNEIVNGNSRKQKDE